jgi:N-acetylneuraminic acid mutarotase
MDKWTRKADISTPRHSLSVSAIDGMIYAIGGGKGSDRLLGATSLDPGPVEVYDPRTGKWQERKDMPEARRGHDAGVVDGKIYITGGMRDGVFPPEALEYNPETDQWQKRANIPTPRALHTVSVIHDRIYAIGGTRGLGMPSPAAEEYDPVTDTWTKRTDMPTARCDISSSVLDGRTYVFGGWNGNSFLTTVEEYNADKSIENGQQAVFPRGKLVSRWAAIKTSSLDF